ncbi:S41 family peptidase [Patescibacteria group bacterium]
MKKIKKYITIAPILVVLFITIFGLGFFIGTSNQPSIEKICNATGKDLRKPESVDFSLFWDTWNVIEQKYVDRYDLDYQKMVYGSISGLVNSLDDPYSIFMEPQQSKRFLDDIGGSFGGIGAEVGIRKGVLTVIAPLAGNPAKEAGLRAGDKILKVDEALTMDLTLDESVDLIRGEKGTEVSLLISRDEWDEAKEIKIMRDEIKIPVFNWKIIDGNIAYVEFYHFTENSDKEFKKIANEISKSNINGLILDIRDNPGGYLESAVDIASWFVPKGEVVITEDFGNGEKNEYFSKGYSNKISEIKTVIIMNEGSASASEILAGALRDHKGIQIVGEKSFGKGSVQQLERLKGGSSIKLTIAKWLTPSGACIEKQGIEPDIEIELTDEDIEEMRDPQLDKALELFAN